MSNDPLREDFNAILQEIDMEMKSHELLLAEAIKAGDADARRGAGKPVGELETLAGTVDRIPPHMCEDIATLWGLQNGPGGWDAHVEKIGQQGEPYGSPRCVRSFLEMVRGKDKRD
jgi:hypothetical protein